MILVSTRSQNCFIRIIRSSVRITFPVVFSSVISSGVRIVSMIIGGGGDDEESVRTPLKYKESEEIQCPNVKLSDIYSVPLHARIVGNKLI